MLDFDEYLSDIFAYYADTHQNQAAEKPDREHDRRPSRFYEIAREVRYENVGRHYDVDYQKHKPGEKIILMGLAENEVMPSIEKLSILLSGYFDSPAARSARL